MDLNKKIEHTKQYAEAFWNHEMIDRPYLSVTAPLKKNDFDFGAANCFRAGMSGNYDSFLDPYQQWVDDTYFAAEAIPHVDITLGPDQYAAFLGAKIETSKENATTWVMPCLDDLEGFDVKLDKSPNGYFDILKRYITYASQKAAGNYMINMIDLHSNMDAISALRSAQELIFDIVDTPEEVHRVLDGVNQTYRDVYDMVYQAGNMKNIGTIGWHPVYCEGKSAVLQCDFSCLLSPQMGREFVFPAIEYEASYLDHTVYHLDGKDALCHLDTVLSIDSIDCVQWVPGEGQPRSFEWMDVLKKIQAAGKAVWIFDWTVEEIKMFHKELQPDKVVYMAEASSKDEADCLVEFLTKNT